MTYILFFVIGLSGGSAQFANEDLCWKAGERLVKEFWVGIEVGAPRVRWFCIQSGFKTQ
jgi:hypothetical protein